MTAERCPDCGASLVVALPARYAAVGATTGERDQPMPRAASPPILRCPDCDQYWVRRGARLDPI
jgi:hypothetical protein